MSPDAWIDTKPELEIYADDVRCTHGATVGQLDEQAVFYLRARGIPEAVARRILVGACAGVIVDRIPLISVRQALQNYLMEELSQIPLDITVPGRESRHSGVERSNRKPKQDDRVPLPHV